MLVIFLLLYALVAAVLFIAGLVVIIVNSGKKVPVKPGVQMLLASVIMVVIGFGACAVILFNS